MQYELLWHPQSRFIDQEQIIVWSKIVFSMLVYNGHCLWIRDALVEQNTLLKHVFSNSLVMEWTVQIWREMRLIHVKRENFQQAAALDFTGGAVLYCVLLRLLRP